MTFQLRRHDGGQTMAMMEPLADAYLLGYADDPDIGHSIYARDEFTERTTRQASSPGFTLVTAHDQTGTLAGFTFGLPFAGGRWWRGRLDAPPDQRLLAPNKFAVIELVILPAARGVRLATRLMGAVLRDRPEPFATLLADHEGHARSIYDHWGWKQVGTVRPAADVPPLDILIRTLDQWALQGPSEP